MIDFDKIMEEFSAIAREPTYVPTLSTNVGGLKNVYQSRPEDASEATYPYIILELLNIQHDGGWLIDETVDSNDNVVYHTNYELLLGYHVFGEGSFAIANQLEGLFRFETVRDQIDILVGGKIGQTFPIQSLPQSLASKFVDSATFEVTLAITDSSVDLQSGIIKNLALAGELIHAGYGDSNSSNPDPAPVSANINIDFNA